MAQWWRVVSRKWNCLTNQCRDFAIIKGRIEVDEGNWPIGKKVYLKGPMKVCRDCGRLVSDIENMEEEK